MFGKAATLTEWMDKNARLVAKSENFSKWNLPDIPLPHPMLRIDDPRIPKWYKETIAQMPICYITVRPGMEANYLVLLNSEMEKFYEIYLAE